VSNSNRSGRERREGRTFGRRRRWRLVWVPVGLVILLNLGGVPVSGSGDAAQAGADSTVAPADTTLKPGDAALVPGDAALAPGDTTIVYPEPVTPAYRHSVFDSIPKCQYLLRRSYSLDNFLESEPGFFLGRFGPIGKDALVSRYSFGRGRGAVYLNDTPVNDPQNDIAHVAFIPVAGLGLLLENGGVEDMTPAADGLEGRLRVVESEPPDDQPATFLELSKSTQRRLRQRRVWFSSMKGNIGLDVGYDEILNDGYAFDARSEDDDDYVFSQEYGRSNSRYLTINLRGQLANHDRYAFTLRRFIADSLGDLRRADAEQRLDGHIASVTAWMGSFKINVFSRGYDATTWPSEKAAPDSNSVNLTTAGYVDWTLARSQSRILTLGGGFEQVGSVQNVDGASSDDRLRKTSLRLTGYSELGTGFVARMQLSGAYYHGLTFGWGGLFSVDKELGRHDAGLYLRRGYRMPNLGELYLPAHAGGTGDRLTISGNEDVDSEFGWEIGGRFTTRVGALTNELRVLGLTVNRPIAFTETAVNGEDWLVANNGDEETAGVIEDRLRVDATPGSFLLSLTGSVAHTLGDRDMYFRTVPRWNAHASFRFGRSFFQTTSALYVGADYTYCSSRLTVSGGELPEYQVLNLFLDGRLLDAQLYLAWLNVLDERYQTIEGYLMMPRTIVYGVAWQIWD
jgi:hypothetical protein